MASEGTSKKKVAEGEGRILISFVLDKSGSMESIRDAAIAGFNAFKKDQADADGEAMFSLVQFDEQCYESCWAVPVREVPDLDRESYVTGTCTALYDAIGFTIARVDDHLLAAGASSPDQVLFVILTDGCENASREFDQRQVFDMIRERQERGYEFIYLGANQDSFAASEGIGIAPGRSRNWDANQSGAAEVMEDLSLNVRGFRERGARASDDWFTEGMREDGRAARGQ